MRHRLDPELDRHRVPVHAEAQLLQRRHAERLEPAERVGDAQAQPPVEHRRDLPVDRPPVRRRQVVPRRLVAVPRPAQQVRVVLLDRPEKVGQARRLVLLVAVHRDQPVVPVTARPAERVADAPPVPPVPPVPDHVHRQLRQQARRVVRRAVVDHQHVLGVLLNLRQHADHVLLFVVNGDGDQGSQNGLLRTGHAGRFHHSPEPGPAVTPGINPRTHPRTHPPPPGPHPALPKVPGVVGPAAARVAGAETSVRRVETHVRRARTRVRKAWTRGTGPRGTRPGSRDTLPGTRDTPPGGRDRPPRTRGSGPRAPTGGLAPRQGHELRHR